MQIFFLSIRGGEHEIYRQETEDYRQETEDLSGICQHFHSICGEREIFARKHMKIFYPLS